MADVELFEAVKELKQNVYFIADKKSKSILPPFLAQNDDEAKRNFINLCNYSNSTLARFPEDFSLYKIGEFVVAFTGTKEQSELAFERHLYNYELIANASDCIQPDTVKYDELKKQVSEALKTVSNSNSVLLSQIGDVPNLQEQINVISAQITDITVHLDKLDNIDKAPIPSSKSFLDKLFDK